MFSIRRAVEADCPSIYDVHMSAIRDVCAAVYTSEEIHGWTVNKTPQGYVHAIAASDFFVASDSERIVGFSEFNPQSDELSAVYVHADFIRHGIGMALLRSAEDAARARKVSRLHLRATLNAVAFYEAAGYTLERLGTTPLSSGIELRCAFMHKTLAKP